MYNFSLILGVKPVEGLFIKIGLKGKKMIAQSGKSGAKARKNVFFYVF